MLHEAFLYCWTNTAVGKMYIGYHVGTEDDGYVCSSKYMKKEYKESPELFTRQIIAYGTEDDIRNLETTVLTALDAANDEQFYNLSNYARPRKTGWRHSPYSKQKISEAGHGNKRSCGPSERKRVANTGKRRTDEQRARVHLWTKGNKSNTGRVWINNGQHSTMINQSQSIPDGYTLGRGKKNTWSK